VTAIFNWLERQLKPPQLFSWQTLVLIAIASLLASFVFYDTQIAPFAARVMYTCGWIFFILGVAWWQLEQPWRIFGLFVGPWLVSAIICMVFLTDVSNQFAIVSWSVLGAAIALIPEFFTKDNRFQFMPPNKRPQAAIVVLSGVLLACWLQFYFVIQDWLNEYPSLQFDFAAFNRSNFVLAIGSPKLVRELQVLDAVKSVFDEALLDVPWSQAERWLYERRDGLLDRDRFQAYLDDRQDLEENSLWRPQFKITRDGSDYVLTISVIWEGLTPIDGGYAVQQTCRVRKVTRSRDENAESSARSILECDPIRPSSSEQET
jgi:hypothetical protein